MRALSLLACALLCLPARADVLVVDQNASSGFIDILHAVNAAAPGDIILVKPGSYAAPTLGDKSLALVARPGTVQLNGELEITGLDADMTVVVRGFRSDAGAGGFFGPWWLALRMRDCEGHVRLEECTFKGTHGFTGPFGGVSVLDAFGAVSIENCDDVVFTHCDASGGHGLSSDCDAGSGATAVQVDTSRVAFFGGDYLGGSGADGCLYGGSGGHGIYVLGASETHIQGITARGGDAGFGASYSGGGGTGVASNGLSLSVVDCDLVGGFSPGPFQSGEGLAALNATLFPGPARDLRVSAPLFAGGWGTLIADGVPGEQVVLLVSLRLGQYPLQGGASLALAPMPNVLAPVGSVGAAGTLNLTLAVPHLEPGVESLVAQAQAAFIGAGGWRLGPASSLMIATLP